MRGLILSCGCLHSERARARATKHGGAYSREYLSWGHAKQRCTNPRNKNYFLYGGRGITMCERWLNDFGAFYADMGPKPSPRHTLERRDNNRGYSPDNCVWATQLEQCNNLRKNVRLTYDGLTLTLAEWDRRLGFNNLVRQRLLKGWPIERVLAKERQHRSRPPSPERTY